MDNSGKRKAQRAEAKPDLKVLNDHLFNEFLNEPGIFAGLEKLLDQVRLEDGENRDLPLPEVELLTSVESSHLSNMVTLSLGRAALPPLPSLISSPPPSLQHKENHPFYLQCNIDGLPNSLTAGTPPSPPYCSPTVPRLHSAVKVIVSSSEDIDKIPRFHSAFLSPPPLPQSLTEKVQSFFFAQPGEQVTPATAFQLHSVVDLQPYLCVILCNKAFGEGADGGNSAQLLSFLQSHSLLLQDIGEEERAFNLLAGCTGSRFLQPEDLQPLVRVVLESHGQLELFRRDPSSRDLHSLFITFVLSSIFFRAGGSAWRTRRLALHQFRRIGLLDMLDKLWKGELDLNLIDHFSYDQFYVFFVKFLEVCGGEKASPAELLQWALEEGDQHSRLLVERIWQVPGAVDRSGSMQFWHWVGFLLAAVDTSSVSALEYWFPVLDIDGDGLLSLDELHERA